MNGWDSEAGKYDEEPEGAREVPTDGPRAGAPVSEVLAAAVDDAVRARVDREAAAMAEVAFEEILTPELSTTLQQRARASTAAALAADTERDEQAQAGTFYPDVEGWVAGFFAHAIVRWASQEFLWCPQWWNHAEVVSRLTGLWITWEKARLGDAADINTWWLQQLDPHLAVITAQGGPLTGCNQSDGHGGTRAGLLIAPSPPGWFGPSQTTATA
jgi:hypothetical protein